MLSLLFTILLGSTAPALALPASRLQPVRRFQIDQRFTVAVAPPETHAITLWVPLPIDDPWQVVTGLAVEGAPFEVVHDARYGNTAARFSLPVQGGSVTLRFVIERHERGSTDLARATGRAAPDGYQRWLAPDALVPIDARVRRIATDVIHGAQSPLARARAVYDYVLSTMHYEKRGTGWGRGDFMWACDMKYGNCTDFHALFIGLLRALGIPARFQIGYAVPDGKSGELPGYHCWADFYLDGVGWVPVDASEGWKHPDRRAWYFGHHDANRFALSFGRDITLPGMRGAALNYFVYPYAEADGHPIKVERTSRYTSLP